MSAARPSVRPAWLAAAGVLIVMALSAWYRAPGFTQGGFASHDVAGMLYNAMLLHDGALPYVDSVEWKAPGSFWLAKWLAGPEGRDIARFQVWANAWALASLLAVAAVAWRSFGPSTAVVAAAVYGLHDAHLDSMDANYVTWAQLPMIGAVGWGLAALRAPTRDARRLGWFVAGLAAGVAMLLKRPAIAVAVWCLVVAAWRGRGTRGRALDVGCVAVGIVLAHAPIGLRYLAAGELSTLWGAYALSDWGFEYVGSGGRSDGTPALVDGMWAFVHFLVLAAALAATAIRAPKDDPDRDLAGPLWVWVAVTLAFASVGFRFYKGYFLAVAPGLAVLAAAPWGLAGTRLRVPALGRAVMIGIVAILVGRQVQVLEPHRDNRAMVHDRGGRIIAEHVGRYSQPGDRIWCWGWHLWDVYPFTGLRSGSRIYKSSLLLTIGHDDTWRLPSTRLKFRDGPYAHMLVEELRQSRPVWIVLGSTVPRGSFRELTALLRSDYELDRRVRIGQVQFWWRKDRAQAHRAAGTASSSSGS